jgi:DNA-binding MarR family transcriptional regulator
MSSVERDRATSEADEAILGALIALGHVLENDWIVTAGKHKLSSQMASVVWTLGRIGATKVSDLAHALKCDAGNSSGTIDRLEELGLAQRVASDVDRLVRMLERSKPGARIAAQIERDLERTALRQRLLTLASDERDLLRKLLARLRP